MGTFEIILQGCGTVFVGLICLIFIIKIYSFLCTKFSKKKDQKVTEAVQQAQAPEVEQPIENRQEIIAAVAAAVATVMGTQTEAIRIVSFTRVSGGKANA